MTQGQPEHDAVVHRRVPQRRPGMVEGDRGAWTDYRPKMVCLHGGFHIRFTDNLKRVTCPRCLTSQ